MSKIGCFSIHDAAVGAFLPPFYARSKGEATRSFTDAVNDPKGQFGRFAKDYSLHFLGEFDDNLGMFITAAPIRMIGAVEVLVQEVQAPGMFEEPPRDRRLPPM